MSGAIFAALRSAMFFTEPRSGCSPPTCRCWTSTLPDPIAVTVWHDEASLIDARTSQHGITATAIDSPRVAWCELGPAERLAPDL
jgi:hypothetical protein